MHRELHVIYQFIEVIQDLLEKTLYKAISPLVETNNNARWLAINIQKSSSGIDDAEDQIHLVLC